MCVCLCVCCVHYYNECLNWFPLQDGLVLNHWRREADDKREYPYARFNKVQATVKLAFVAHWTWASWQEVVNDNDLLSFSYLFSQCLSQHTVRRNTRYSVCVCACVRACVRAWVRRRQF